MMTIQFHGEIRNISIYIFWVENKKDLIWIYDKVVTDVLILVLLNPDMSCLCSVDPDQLASSYLDLHFYQQSDWLKIRNGCGILFVCVVVLRPSQPNGSCRARSVYLTTRLLGRFSPLRR